MFIYMQQFQILFYNHNYKIIVINKIIVNNKKKGPGTCLTRLTHHTTKTKKNQRSMLSLNAVNITMSFHFAPNY